MRNDMCSTENIPFSREKRKFSFIIFQRNFLYQLFHIFDTQRGNLKYIKDTHTFYIVFVLKNERGWRKFDLVK